MQEGNFLHFLMVSIGPPARRASFTAFSSFLAAALGAFFLTTTGSQSCDTGPIPAMAPFSFSPSLQKRKKTETNNSQTQFTQNGFRNALRTLCRCPVFSLSLTSICGSLASVQRK